MTSVITLEAGAHYTGSIMTRILPSLSLCLCVFATFSGCSSSSETPSNTAQAGSTTGTNTGGTAGAAGTTATGGTVGATGGAGSSNAGASGSNTGGAATGGAAGQSSGGESAGGATAGAGGAAGASGAAGAGGTVNVDDLDPFSFFVTSLKAMRQLSGSQDGFGGDLTYGEADGLTGADKICTEIAEMSMPGSGAKEWHAFLSTVAGPVHARDRIGTGPWYDRLGRKVADGLEDLLQNRPANADAMIKEDLPNEDGVPNKRPDPNLPEDDTHHFLTGSDTDGMLYTDEERPTCADWTSTSMDNSTTGEGVGRPRIGFSFTAGGRTNWISGQTEGGCGAGVTGIGMVNGGSDPENPIVGSGGGYGGIYCFAMSP